MLGAGTTYTCRGAQAHGWAVRGDDKDEEVAKQARDAYQLAEKWFKKHL